MSWGLNFYGIPLFIRMSRVYSFCLSVHMLVCSYLRSSVTFMEFTTKFYVKVSQIGYISAAIYQKAFIFGSSFIPCPTPGLEVKI